MTHISKINEAGEMHVITLRGTTSYIIATKEGFYRGGKIYFSDKIFRVLSGEVELIYEENNLDIHQIITSTSGEKMIPAGIPHIFKSRTDSVFLESFPESTKSEEFERYRLMKK